MAGKGVLQKEEGCPQYQKKNPLLLFGGGGAHL